jgi:hypothetical protein
MVAGASAGLHGQPPRAALGALPKQAGARDSVTQARERGATDQAANKPT